MKAKAVARPVLHVAEPPPAFLARPPIVVDCSVLSAVLFEEETREDALRIIAGKTLHAPLLLDSEIVASKKKRAGAPQAAVTRALSAYAEQALEVHRPDVRDAGGGEAIRTQEDRGVVVLIAETRALVPRSACRRLTLEPGPCATGRSSAVAARSPAAATGCPGWRETPGRQADRRTLPEVRSHVHQGERTGGLAGDKFNEKINVAVGPFGARCGRPEQAQPAHVVAPADLCNTLRDCRADHHERIMQI